MTPEQIERLMRDDLCPFPHGADTPCVPCEDRHALLAEWEERGKLADHMTSKMAEMVEQVEKFRKLAEERGREIERLRVRVSWFERGGGVDKTTAFFREQIRAEQAEARLAKVVALHQPVVHWRGMGHDITACETCGVDAGWPCPTLAAAQQKEEHPEVRWKREMREAAAQQKEEA